MKSSFSGAEIEPGTGFMYVLKDGKVFYFKNRKEFINMFELKRKQANVKWTEFYHKQKEVTIKSKKKQTSKTSSKVVEKKTKVEEKGVKTEVKDVKVPKQETKENTGKVQNTIEKVEEKK